jgi:lactoylglutathione lyase
MTLRCEIFPHDLDAVVDFYTRVLGLRVTQDERGDAEPYVALQRGSVQIGSLARATLADPAARRPPAGTELVLEVDDVTAERGAAWPANRLPQTCWPSNDPPAAPGPFPALPTFVT